MNNAGGQQGQAGQAGQAQPRPPPMYQPAQIRNLPLLSEEEKVKYEHGVTGLWARMNNSPPNSQEHLAARNKIIEFSRMLITKIQGRRAQAQQQQGQQAGAQRPQGQAGQQQQAAAQQKPTPAAAAAKPAGNANGGASAQSTAAEKASATAAALTQPKVPERLMQHVNKMTFKAPHHLAEKSPADAAKWIEDLKVRYGRALMTMESAKAKVATMDKGFHDRAQAGNPLKDEELRQYREHREKQLELHSNGQKWIETVRKQQEGVQGLSQGQNAGAAAAAQNKANGTPTQQNQNVTASVNAAVEAAKNQQQMAGQPSPAANNTPTPQQQQQHAARMAQNAAAVKQEPQPPPPVNTALANAQAQTPAQGAARVGTPQSANAQAPGGPTRALSHSAAMSLANQRAAAQPANAAAMANQQQQQQPQQQQPPQQQQQQQPQQQQAAGTPNGGTPGAVSNTGVNTAVQPQQTQQGHPHAHPPQQQQQPPASLQSKMPIQKQLPERATAVPQGVTLGGGVAAGRPTLSQGGGTLGGVMNQPAMAKVPAYSHDAEGDHVLSKKKLDELVRQVCGAPAEGSDSNLLTPEVEEVRNGRYGRFFILKARI